jgi:hypothetical protein
LYDFVVKTAASVEKEKKAKKPAAKAKPAKKETE